MVLPVAVTPYRKTSPARANARPMRAWLAPPISGPATAGVGAGGGDGSCFGASSDVSALAFGADRARRDVGTTLAAGGGRDVPPAAGGAVTGGVDGAAAGPAPAVS